MRQVRTLSATCDYSLAKGESVIKQIVRLRIKRPNMYRADFDLFGLKKDGKRESYPSWQTLASDGKNAWRVYSRGKEFETWAAGANEGEGSLRYILPLAGFFSPDSSPTRRLAAIEEQGLLRSLGLPQAGKNPVIRLEYRLIGSSTVATEDYTVGPEGLINRVEVSMTDGRKVTYFLRNLKIDAPMASQAFAYKVPTGYNPRKAVSSNPTKLLREGTVAPDFTVDRQDMSKLKLSDYQGRFVVLNFWATWCAPCMQEMPNMNALAKQYADRNVVFLAVDTADKRELFDKWLKGHPEFASLIFAHDPTGFESKGIDMTLYASGALPTTYVIGPDGKIVAGFVGFGDGGLKALEDALNKALGN